MVKTKAYTLNRLINEVSGITGKSAATYDGVIWALSPYAGNKSAKAKVINNFLDGNFYKVLAGTGTFATYGATPRTRLLKALRFRKTRGF